MSSSTTSAPDGAHASTVEVALRWVDALNSGDRDAIRETFAPDATWWLAGDLPVAGTYEGRDAVLDGFLAKGLGLFAPGSPRFEVVNTVAQADQVVLELTVSGQSAAGAAYDNHYAMVLTVGDGRVRAVREYLDTLYAMRVLWPTAAAPRTA